MIKKIIYISLISCMIFSCGKKGDPEFKESNYIKINKVKII